LPLVSSVTYYLEFVGAVYYDWLVVMPAWVGFPDHTLWLR